jgi:hypothetical protein
LSVIDLGFDFHDPPGPAADVALHNDLEQQSRTVARTFLRTAMGKASNSSSVVPKPVMLFIFLWNRFEGKLREESGRSKDWAYSVRGEKAAEESRSVVELVWGVEEYRVVVEMSDKKGISSLGLLRLFCNRAMTSL